MEDSFACCDSAEKNSEALECEICCKWHHISCVKVERTLYASLKKYKSENIVFICPTCIPVIRWFRPNVSSLLTPQFQNDTLGGHQGEGEISPPNQESAQHYGELSQQNKYPIIPLRLQENGLKMVKMPGNSLYRGLHTPYKDQNQSTYGKVSNKESRLYTHFSEALWGHRANELIKELGHSQENKASNKGIYLGKNRRKNKIKCETCDVLFSDATGLENHIKLNHSNKEKEKEVEDCDLPEQCPVCNKKFKEIRAMKIHVKNVHSRKRSHCDLCKATFTRKKALNNHVEKVHLGLKVTENKDQLCETCGKAFASKLLLKRHSTVHTGEKPHSCSVCGKAFRIRQLLSKHMVTHTGIFKHQCTTCGKMFSSSYNLKIHERIHSGAKPFKCNFCEMSFRVKCSLKDHLKEHTGERKKTKDSIMKDDSTYNLQYAQNQLIPSSI